MSDEEDLNQLTIQAQILQRQGSALQNQLDIFQETLADINSAIETLENLPKAKEEGRVPIGAGVYVTCNKIQADDVLVTVGAGLLVQKKAADAIEMIKGRQKSVSEAFDKAQKNLIAINRQMQDINSKASLIAQRMEENVRPAQV
jgi:prefoldin alpha subunit